MFALGVKHGFDPDHLVAIDGLTRSSARGAARPARWAGLFFSLGHGAIVTLIGLALALFAGEWSGPAWLQPLGTSLSIAVLGLLGIANLVMVWRTSPDASVTPIALRGRWLRARFSGASHPAVVVAIGAAFALSFDTVSHALVFSLSGATAAGALFALVLGLVFTLGMTLTDTLNGWWVARMVQRADRRAAAASRWMGIAIGALCLAIAAGALARIAFPALERFFDLAAPAISVATFAAILAPYRAAAR